MEKVLVIGYGNPLRSDDSFGLRALQSLRETVTGPDVSFIECHQLNPELAEAIAIVDYVIFLDTSTDGVAGAIHYTPLSPEVKSLTMTHHISPGVLLGTARALYGKCPAALLATVTGECFGHGTELSPCVQAAMRGVVKHVADLIHERVTEPVAR